MLRATRRRAGRCHAASRRGSTAAVVAAVPPRSSSSCSYSSAPGGAEAAPDRDLRGPAAFPTAVSQAAQSGDDTSTPHHHHPPAWPAESVAALQPATHERTALTAAASARLSAVVAERQAGSPTSGGVGVGWVVADEPHGEADRLHRQARSTLAIGCGVGSSDSDGGVGIEAALEELITAAGPGTVDNHGGYMAYAPSGAMYASTLASFVCSSLNPGLTWQPTSPEIAAVEQAAVDWLATDVCRWPVGSSASGVFASGGSVANALGLHVSRVAAASMASVEETDVTFLVPPEAHYCIRKSLRVLGVPAHRIHAIPMHPNNAAEGRFDQLDLSFVAWHLRQAEAPGGGAVVIVATAGTTSTGLIDDMATLAELRDAHNAHAGGGCWLHVDGCFGGFFMLTRRGRESCLG
jgi:hypothetical protein|eukprot:COSAG01_NODE_70_length_28755_cov_34.709067_28_plen_408_part_00